MKTWQIVLLTVLALVLTVVMIATWGSIGSVCMGFCLGAMGLALLWKRFLIDRDDKYFYE